MPLLTAAALAAMMESKPNWSARDTVVESLQAAETADPSVVPELPAEYALADVVEALVALGLVTVAS